MKWLICIDNTDYPAALEQRKLYETVVDKAAETLGLVRVIDESGESYLYDKSLFIPLEVSSAVTSQLLSANV